MPVSAYSMTLRDWSRELASLTFPIRTVTAATLPDILTDGNAFEAAVDAVTLGVQAKQKLTAFENLDVSVPASPVAQRELAWVVHYHDATEFFDPPTNSIFNENYGKPETLRIPTADVTSADLMQPNSDLADLTQPEWSAFVTAFVDLAQSRGGGVVAVDYIELSRGAK